MFIVIMHLGFKMVVNAILDAFVIIANVALPDILVSQRGEAKCCLKLMFLHVVSQNVS